MFRAFALTFSLAFCVTLASNAQEPFAAPARAGQTPLFYAEHPYNGACDVPVNANITFGYDAPVNLPDKAFRLYFGTFMRHEVDGVLRVDETRMHYLFEAYEPLRRNERYFYDVCGVADDFGNAVADRCVTFCTEDYADYRSDGYLWVRPGDYVGWYFWDEYPYWRHVPAPYHYYRGYWHRYHPNPIPPPPRPRPVTPPWEYRHERPPLAPPLAPAHIRGTSPGTAPRRDTRAAAPPSEPARGVRAHAPTIPRSEAQTRATRPEQQRR